MYNLRKETGNHENNAMSLIQVTQNNPEGKVETGCHNPCIYSRKVVFIKMRDRASEKREKEMEIQEMRCQLSLESEQLGECV